MSPNKRYPNIKEFTGTKHETNGALTFTYKAWKEERKSMVDLTTMSWMQQKELINFVNKWEFLTRILESVRNQNNNIK